jgi:predicted nucleic acid-binding protein
MVIDASVAFKWIVDEEGSAAAAALIGREDLIAPALLHAEVANALWTRLRRGELRDGPEPSSYLSRLSSLVRTVDETLQIGRALQLATQLDHPVYDCIYLAIAEAYERKLVTADGRFAAKAAECGFAHLIRPLQ